MVVPVNSFVVLGCGACAIAAGSAIHSNVALLRRWLIPPQIVGGLLLAAITMFLRHHGWVLEVDSTVQQVTMVALFTAIGFNMSREAIVRGGRPVFLLLLMFWVGAMVQNGAGVAMARALGLHPLLGIATGAVALAGGPATSLAFGPDLERAGAEGATSAALAAAILGILVSGLLTGSLGAALIRRDRLHPDTGSGPLTASSSIGQASPREFLPTLVLFGAAMGLGQLVTQGMNVWLRAFHTSLPAYAGAMIVAAAIRACSNRLPALAIDPAWNHAIGSAALSWFIPLAVWTLRYWELTQLAPPILAILAVQLPLTIALGWAAYRVVGRTFDSAVMASAYFGFMFGTMANSLAAMDELQRRFGPCPRAFLVIPLAGGVLSDFANLLAIVLSRALFAGGL